MLHDHAARRHAGYVTHGQKSAVKTDWRGTSLKRKRLSVCSLVLLGVSLISSITYRINLYRGHELLQRINTGPPEFFERQEKLISLDTHLFWVSVIVAVLSGIALATLLLNRPRFN